MQNEVSKLLLRADPNREKHISDLHKEILSKITDESRKNIKALTKPTYEILLSWQSSWPAFAFSGWYRTDDAIPATKESLRAFFIFNSLAMCSSLFVAFISVIARWEDLDSCFATEKSQGYIIMWLAYMATITAFATGLYTILAPRLLWLPILICCLSVLEQV
ncbi:hypothetical protein U9M48_016425 [Paspalum notatum var. saurae]|uniref:PGG domain-containing protein n=1 Tax=Paspalum notatum var. saurae TaxID=547442 RepID=A0AAQ3T8Q7_PASNO